MSHWTLRDEVPMVFPGRSEAEEAAAALYRMGMADAHLLREMAAPGPYKFEEDAEADLFRAWKIGVVVGIPVFIGVAMGIIALALGGLGELGWGGLFLASAWEGIFAGIFLGGVAGLATKVTRLEEHEHWVDTPLAPEEVLIVARSHGRQNEVRSVLERHHGRVPTGSRAA